MADERGQDVAAVTGQPAVIADIRETMNRDFLRTMGFVIGGIFIVLLLMLRSLIAPIYLILTVVITYAFTLGLTDVVFRLVFGVESLSWYMPFFTFIFLVALGVDYSIFLIGRVKEEVHTHGTREGVEESLAFARRRQGVRVRQLGIRNQQLGEDPRYIAQPDLRQSRKMRADERCA